MTEIKQEIKKRGKIRRVFKWLGVGVLGFLVILALVFQAPWKVTTLLAILLAACTILPKRYRQWFWLSTAGVVVILIIWIFLPDDKEGWRPYTFDKELVELEAQYKVPDEQNAALFYIEIFENLDVDSNQPEFYCSSSPSSKDEPWLSKDQPETAEWLKGHQETIEKLMKVSQKEKCLFAISADSWDFDENMDRLSTMRQCAFLLISVANNDIAEGRIDAGIKKYLCVHKIADHLYQQPVAIDFLVGSALEHLALTQLNRFVIENKPMAEQLRLIINALGYLENNWSSEFKKFLESDKLFTKNTYCSLAYEVNPEGKVRSSRDPIASFRAAFPKEIPAQTYCNRRLHRAKAILAWFFLPSNPKKVAEIIDASYDNYYAMSKLDYNWTKQSPTFDSGLIKTIITRFRFNEKYIVQCIAQFYIEISKETYRGLHDAYLNSLALRRGSRLLIVIKQYHNENGTWPESLEEIKSAAPAEAFIDPVTGNQLQYEKHGESFSLCSDDVNIWPM